MGPMAESTPRMNTIQDTYNPNVFDEKGQYIGQGIYLLLYI